MGERNSSFSLDAPGLAATSTARRSVIKGMAWTVPVVMIGSTTPAIASSCLFDEIYRPSEAAGEASTYIFTHPVPAGVTQVTVEIIGANGAGTSAWPGGAGAYIGGILTIPAGGADLEMIVGSGGLGGGFGGAVKPGGTGYGQGGSAGGVSGSGGGGSALKMNGALVAVAGGGGGRGVITSGGGNGGISGSGGDSGLVGEAGAESVYVHPNPPNSLVKGPGGGGATGTSGGAAGAAGSPNGAVGHAGGNNGTGLNGGGDGGNGIAAQITGFPATSGGGGGGYAGGGSGGRGRTQNTGGRAAGGGGGGSSYIGGLPGASVSSSEPNTSGDGNAGWIRITYSTCGSL